MIYPSFKNPHNHDIFCAAEEQSLEEPSEFRVKKEEQFILIMWTGHILNLAAYDMVKQSKIMKDSLDTTFGILKLVEFSPNNDSRFEKLKQELAPMYSPGLRVLCVTGWSVCAKSVLDNYTVLLTL